MKISSDIKYVGVNDHSTDLFEGQYSVPNGISYNSYLITDEKNAVLDTVDAAYGAEWMENVKFELGEKKPDYLIVHHMEPDHSANIKLFTDTYPNAKVVSSAKAFAMMVNFFGTEFADKRVIVGEGDKLALGTHTLNFITAPMVHWPEVIMSYESTEKILFSADGFGKFGALDAPEPWIDEARRYYIGIVGKYGVQVQAVLKKAAALDIKLICPLHGPCLEKDLSYYIKLYDTWSSYAPEKCGTLIAYTSIYGNTKKAAVLLHELLTQKGIECEIFDLARCDMSEVTAKAFCYDKLVLASPTYNGDVFPFMREFLAHLTERNYQNRKVGFIENGSWAPIAAKVMRGTLEKCKNLSFTNTTVTVRSALNDMSREAIVLLSDELSNT